MIIAVFESIKYVGHLLPVAFLRIFIGYFYLNLGLNNYHNGYLSFAYLAEGIRNYMPKSTAPDWYKVFLDQIVVTNWQLFAWIIVGLQLFIGMSYIIGYLVRPSSLLAILLTIGLILAVGSEQAELPNHFMPLIHFTLGWMGAGRCLGIDYFFYKRRRGIWW